MNPNVLIEKVLAGKEPEDVIENISGKSSIDENNADWSNPATAEDKLDFVEKMMSNVQKEVLFRLRNIFKNKNELTKWGPRELVDYVSEKFAMHGQNSYFRNEK